MDYKALNDLLDGINWNIRFKHERFTSNNTNNLVVRMI
jgi:hypothetical protein